MDFLVMEYIPGITLSEKVAAGPMPEKEVLRLGVAIKTDQTRWAWLEPMNAPVGAPT